jgi:hypothetical protein
MVLSEGIFSEDGAGLWIQSLEWMMMMMMMMI